MTHEEFTSLLETLKETHSNRLARELALFVFLVSEWGSKKFKSRFGEQLYYRRVKQLREAGIVLTTYEPTLPADFRLEIPSPYVVNTEDEPVDPPEIRKS